MSTKLYLCLRCEKRTKSISELTKHLNACKNHIYPKTHKKFNKNIINKKMLQIEIGKTKKI